MEGKERSEELDSIKCWRKEVCLRRPLIRGVHGSMWFLSVSLLEVWGEHGEGLSVPGLGASGWLLSFLPHRDLGNIT